jgi:dTDP-4-dehydrorhamnose 3,5-epimerase
MIVSRHLDGIVVYQQPLYADERGWFCESYRKDQFPGCPSFVQDNHSRSRQNVIRGLHFQVMKPMGKLMRVTHGEAMLVAVDVRLTSLTLGKHVSVHCTEFNRLQVYAPAGFARGFCALTEFVEVQYKCTALHNPAGDRAILYSDPDIGIDWPVDDPIVSEKDRKAPTLEEYIRKG